MAVAILMNAGAGQLSRATCEARAEEILASCRALRIEAKVHLCEPARLTETARSLARSGVDAIVAAGGDGTVSAIAAALVDTGTPLGVLPLGTMNHFSKDLGIRDLATALEVVAGGHTVRVDVGEANGHVFINNSSIGLYPQMVMSRDRQRHELGRSKWRAMSLAAMRVLLRFPLLHVAIALGDRVVRVRTPFIMVGNNEYATNVRGLGGRPHLDRGQLSVYTVRATRRLHMFWVIVRTLLWRGHADDFEAHTVERADIVTKRKRLRVAFDGEVVRMATPLRFRVRPGALVVLAPVPVEAAVPRAAAGGAR